ncbi:hypothetical protein [Jiangella anatolica]|uniref:DUF3800 domain-containing protein n=1 Tax=Jiangella anatolica TaxID=2670374 RepID=A0A2W2CSA9_9ACTN|nr:hypothetical protein [Jiangella anatolica]PZF83083.1 hypothetical protein C1I92_14300 [Jiangella anatolica]
MAWHAYVDESKRRDYIVAAAVIAADGVVGARQAMRGLLVGKQQRIHFKDEKPARKELIIATALDLCTDVRLYVCRTRHSARESCLQTMVPDLVDIGVDRLVLERDQSTVQLDKQVLYEATRKVGAALTYHHHTPHQEPLLWVPDAIAWCWAAGGAWRQRVSARVTVFEAR